MHDRIIHQAAEWIVQLSADDCADQAHARSGFETWKNADPRHAAAVARMQGLIDQTQLLRRDASTASPAAPAHAALTLLRTTGRKQGRVKRAGAALAMALVLAFPAWITLQNYPPAYLTADLHASTGQWKTHTLADGTRVTLKNASAVNLRFDAQRRRLELVRGEILVEVAHDAARPFVVETAHGSIRALGTRFVVGREDRDTVLTMLESRVLVQTTSQATAATGTGGAAGTVVHAGQRLHIGTHTLGPIEDIDSRSIEDAWKFHQLVVQNRPLPEVLDELDRHRPGHIRYDRAQLEGIRVSAVLPLNDTDRALQLLVDSLPMLRVRTLTSYLVTVDTQVQEP